MKTPWSLLALAAMIAGCTTKSQSQMQAQLAYLAGQNAALRAPANGPGVTITGAVQNSFVPWVAGLTLAQAVATANYVGPDEPAQIILTHSGESITMDVAILLQGVVIPLEPGDSIEIR